jgi:acid phosphatase (class A)
MSEPKPPAVPAPAWRSVSPTSDGGPGGFYSGNRTSDGGPGGRAANSLFAGMGDVPPFLDGPLAGWAGHVAPDSTTKGLFGARFPDDGWDPLMKAGIIAGRFAMTQNWMTETDPGYPPDDVLAYPEKTPEEAKKIAREKLALELKDMWHPKNTIDQRDKQGPEILAQSVGFTGYFFKLLGCSTEVRPRTFLLLLVGIQVGALVCSHWKWKYQRARPGQVWPGINPLIPTPRHPAYPSGHGVQSMLLAEMVAEIAPPLKGSVDAIAKRVTENRVIAGVHYPSDGRAALHVVKGSDGKRGVHKLLRDFDEYKTIRNAAYLEVNGTEYKEDQPHSPLEEINFEFD